MFDKSCQSFYQVRCVRAKARQRRRRPRAPLGRTEEPELPGQVQDQKPEGDQCLLSTYYVPGAGLIQGQEK